MARLEALWFAGASAAPKDEGEVLAFLNRKAYREREIELPLKSADVDDLARHLFRYLAYGGVVS